MPKETKRSIAPVIQGMKLRYVIGGRRDFRPMKAKGRSSWMFVTIPTMLMATNAGCIKHKTIHQIFRCICVAGNDDRVSGGFRVYTAS